VLPNRGRTDSVRHSNDATSAKRGGPETRIAAIAATARGNGITAAAAATDLRNTQGRDRRG